jgi:integrase
VYRKFKEAVAELGEDPRLTVYCLRHATTTRLLQSGAGGPDVAKLTGHLIPGQSPVQLRYYHPDKAHLFKVASKVHCWLGETPQKGEVVEFAPAAKVA